jgi:3-dehydroquinate synthetase
MVAAMRLAVDMKRVERSLCDRLVALLDRIGLPTRATDLGTTQALIAAMQLDKKVADGQIRLILPDRLGAVSIVRDTPAAAIAAAWETLRV